MVSFFLFFNEGGDSEWFINYLKHTIKNKCGEIVYLSERKRENYKLNLKIPLCGPPAAHERGRKRVRFDGSTEML